VHSTQANQINAYKSPNGKIKTEIIEGRFVLAEELKEGSLISIFNENGAVLEQIRSKKGAEESLRNYEAGKSLNIIDSEYKSIEINATCPKCGKKSIKRELDLVDTKKLKEVPLVPIYVCTSCNHAFYSLTKDYLRKLVNEHLDLFSDEELKEMKINEEDFIKELNEYIIRMFASKKLMRIEIGK